jgi:hypothetical protein
MTIIERYKKPTPKFFRTLRNIGIALPALLVTIATYMTVAGTVVTAVSQAVTVGENTEIPR